MQGAKDFSWCLISAVGDPDITTTFICFCYQEFWVRCNLCLLYFLLCLKYPCIGLCTLFKLYLFDFILI